jgi:hypothetical protein
MKTPERQTVVRVAGSWRLVNGHDAEAAGLPESTPERPTALHFLRGAPGAEPPPKVIGRLGYKPRELLDRGVWVEAPIGDAWTASYRIVVQRGVPVVGELRIHPHDAYTRRHPGEWRAAFLQAAAEAPEGGLTARLLRNVRVGAHMKVMKQILERFAGDLKDLGLTMPTPRRAARPVKIQERTHGRDATYARLAEAYVAAWAAGSRTPATDVARRWKLSAAKVRDLLHKARRRDLLTDTPSGKIGGELTDKARELLGRGK